MYGIPLESPIASEVPGVLPEGAFVEVLDDRLPIDVFGNDPGPVIADAVAGGRLGEPLSLTLLDPRPAGILEGA